jgi:hypothetical protein
LARRSRTPFSWRACLQTRIAGARLDTISAEYGVSRDTIWRHMGNHVSEDLRAEYLAAVPMKDLTARAAVEGVSVLVR